MQTNLPARLLGEEVELELATALREESVVFHFERVERMEKTILLNIYRELNDNLGETVIKAAVEFT